MIIFVDVDEKEEWRILYSKNVSWNGLLDYEIIFVKIVHTFDPRMLMYLHLEAMLLKIPGIISTIIAEK